MHYGQNTTSELSEKIIDHLLDGATPTQVAELIDQYIAPLEHHKDSTVGLWATDREDAVGDKELFFQIEF
jgi:hypothetical protein